MVDFLLDANVLVGLLRGNERLRDFLEGSECAIDTVVYVELIQGAKNKYEVARIENALRTFPIVHFNESVSNRTIELIRTYSKSHGLLLADAVIAATCLENGLKLATFNTKDFRFIKELTIVVPRM
ncbi:MAG: type II toxin-antitoxin system VapC family toxin [Pyrinomonadaceae bacterium]